MPRRHTRGLVPDHVGLLEGGKGSYVVVVCLTVYAQNPDDRPTFETLQWRLEDFFVDTGGSYADAPV